MVKGDTLRLKRQKLPQKTHQVSGCIQNLGSGSLESYRNVSAQTRTIRQIIKKIWGFESV